MIRARVVAAPPRPATIRHGARRLLRERGAASDLRADRAFGIAVVTMPTCVLLIGIPASGKSSFFRERFVDTHVRVNRDMLGTAHRERVLVAACLAGGIDFVIDKTNVLRAERARHIARAKDAGFRVEGYFLQSRKAECVERNRGRDGAARIPDGAVGAMSARLELPTRDEGYDALHFVRMIDGGFAVEDWTDAIR